MTLPDEEQKAIVSALHDNRLSTIELEIVLKRKGVRCPDDLARTLNILRRKGTIKGAISQEKGAWVWWVEE